LRYFFPFPAHICFLAKVAPKSPNGNPDNLAGPPPPLGFKKNIENADKTAFLALWSSSDWARGGEVQRDKTAAHLCNDAPQLRRGAPRHRAPIMQHAKDLFNSPILTAVRPHIMLDPRGAAW